MSIKKIAFTGLALAAAFACFAALSPARAADAVLTKAQVEQIVHDYIVNNPKLIMDSVNNYRFQAASQQAEEGVKKNEKELTSSASPVAGNPKGDVTVVEFFDYNCHYCKGSFPSVQALLKDDKNVRFVFKDFPILGPSSVEAAKWALAAQKQGKYFAFHSAMMLNREPITDDLLKSVSKNVGMDVAAAEKDAESADVTNQIEKNVELAQELGISGTPSFVIGNKVDPGVLSEDEMENQITAIRAAAADKK
ncbi:MAG: DsbA family protein [Alphaproteobacteria bacterium]|nr:DsbA family protein [Alphaproteobacteria bacterium]